MRVLAVEYDCGFEDEVRLPPRADKLTRAEQKVWNRQVEEYQKMLEVRHLMNCSGECPDII